MRKKKQEWFFCCLNLALQYIFSCKGYTGKWTTSVFAVYTAYEYLETVFLFIVIILKLALLFAKSATTMCYAIRFQFAAALVAIAGEFFRFPDRGYPYTVIT